MIIHQIIFNIKLIFLFVEHVQDQFDMTERTFRHTIWRTNYQLWKIWRKNKFWPRQSNISQEGKHPWHGSCRAPRSLGRQFNSSLERFHTSRGREQNPVTRQLISPGMGPRQTLWTQCNLLHLVALLWP